MLLLHQGLFIQALEGPKDEVGNLYKMIRQDKRRTETNARFGWLAVIGPRPNPVPCHRVGARHHDPGESHRV